METWYKTPAALALKATTRYRHLRANHTLVGTIATIELADGRYAVGVTECSLKDQPSKDIGKEIAGGRALYAAATSTGLIKTVRTVTRSHYCPYGGPRQNRAVLTKTELETFHELLTVSPHAFDCLNTIMRMRETGAETVSSSSWLTRAAEGFKRTLSLTA